MIMNKKKIIKNNSNRKDLNKKIIKNRIIKKVYFQLEYKVLIFLMII